MTEDEIVGWYHQFDRHELGQTLGDGDGQGSLACCCPWGWEESDTVWRLNNNNTRCQAHIGSFNPHNSHVVGPTIIPAV